MPEGPADRVMHGRATPADIASLDQSRSECRDDLNALIAGYKAAAAKYGDDRAHTFYVIGLMREWPPTSVAAVLVEALRKLSV